MAEAAQSSRPPNALQEAHQTLIRPYLDVIDELRSLGVERETPLPQIAVVGDQSSGKSSLLEALSGIPFPRGTGLTTRCPTQIIMKSIPQPEPELLSETAAGAGVGAGVGAGEESKMGGDAAAKTGASRPRLNVWRATAQVAWNKPQPPEAGPVESPAALTEVIARLQDVITRNEPNGFSSTAIQIELESTDVTDVTVIDLPGIVRTTTAGQSQAVVGQVNGLIESYIMEPRTIILAVIPSNQDIATMEVLEKALRVDPEGDRTIGVLTKADMVDQGGEDQVLAVLRNEIKPLKLGYIIVKNRSQQQINQGLSLDEARRLEREFFQTDERYRNRPEVQQARGVANLSTRLTNVLVRRIQVALPTMKYELEQQQNAADEELKKIGVHVPEDHFSQQRLLMQIISEFCLVLGEAARGDYRHALLAQHSDLRLKGLAETVFRGLRSTLLSRQPNFDSPEFEHKLRAEMSILRGRELPGFVNLQFFFGFMTLAVEEWRPVVESTLSQVSDMIKTTCAHMVERLAAQYPRLTQLVSNVCDKQVDVVADEVTDRVDEVFSRETSPQSGQDDLAAAINKVRFARFDAELENVEKAAEDVDGTMATLKGLMEHDLANWYMGVHGVEAGYQLEDARAVLKAYWNICFRRLLDEICALIDSTLLLSASTDIEKAVISLAQQHINAGSLDYVFMEDAFVVEKRKKAVAKKARVQQGLQAIDRVVPGIVAISPEIAQQTGGATGMSAEQFAQRAIAGGGGTSSGGVGGAAYGAGSRGMMVAAPGTPAFQQQQQEKLQQGASGGVGTDGTSNAGNYFDRTEGRGSGGHHSGLPSPLSEQESMALAAKNGSIAIFTYERDGDNRGLLYWLGTRGNQEPYQNPHDAGRCRVGSSGMAIGSEALVVSRQRAPCSTRDERSSWISLDVGQNVVFAPTHYTLCHGSPDPGQDLTNWLVEGFDERTQRWYPLNDPEATSALHLNSPHGVGTWTMTRQMGEAAFRYIRIQTTRPNLQGSHALALCAFEFYGTLYPANNAQGAGS